MANVTGWGRGTWGDGTWGEPIPVVVSGVNATGAITSVASVSGAASVTVSGVNGTANVSSVVAGIGVDVIVTGVSATGSVGNVNVWANISPSQPDQNWVAESTSQTPEWIVIAA